MSATHDNHAEARRLLALGFKLCKLKPMTKQPIDDAWNKHPVTSIDPKAGGYGLMLPANGLCSIDPDNLEPCRDGLQRVGFDLDEILSAGVRTTSTRPGSGGRSTFRSEPGLAWITFRSKTAGTICELRATSTNLQDTLPGTTYLSRDKSGPWVQGYATERTLDQAPELPAEFSAWWHRLSTDADFLHEQQRLLVGAGVVLSVSSNGKLLFDSPCRGQYNSAHDASEPMADHGYPEAGRGRWSHPNASGAPGIRRIDGKDGLWQSDHGGDPLFGTFDAWVANVQLNFSGDLQAAEAAWMAENASNAVVGFDEGSGTSIDVWPAFGRIKGGVIPSSKSNVVRALQCPPMSGYQIRFDTFRGEVMLAPHGTDAWAPFKETDYMRLALNLEQKKFANIGIDLRREAINFVADQNKFDSAQYWLKGLRWDGVPRVESFLLVYLLTEDTPYTRAVSKYIWTALAGRVMVPGVQADMMPILVGPQGTLKTSSVTAICPSPDYFTSIDLSLSDDDLARLMRAKLVIEMGELKGMSARDAEHRKAFISRRVDEWIPKYQELKTQHPRRSVFFGTSNRDDFLADPTGERRMLPFNCGRCDPEAIARDRDQLWAEARELFNTHGVIHREAERLARDEHAAFADTDDWDDAVRAWLDTPNVQFGGRPAGRHYLTGREVLSGALGLTDAQQTPNAQARIKKVLKRLGYESRNTSVNGAPKSRKFYPPSLF